MILGVIHQSVIDTLSFNDYKLTDNDIEIIRNKINLYGNYDLNDIRTRVL